MSVEREAEAVFQAVAQNLDRLRRLPSSTYRLQFNRNFTFAQAEAIVPYLYELGISDLYASPYLKARPESSHGYDITDHNALNPAIGSMDDYNALIATLKRHGLGQVLDMVPNHMGIGEPSNTWWVDVLENGPSSPYAPFFDIDWHPLKQELENKVLLPILGDQYGTVLENGELVLSYEDGAFFITYYSKKFPIAPETYTDILRFHLDDLITRLGEDNALTLELQSIITALNHLPQRHETDPEKVAERQREKEVIKRRLAALYESAPEVQETLDDAVRAFNGRKGDPHSFDRLDALLSKQAYRLSFWRVAAEEINYRRFFDINDLAAVRMEYPPVFEATHRLVLRLLAEAKVTGLRIDHPDGLWDPEAYLLALQQRFFLQAARKAVADPEAIDWERLEPALLERFTAEQRRHPGAPIARPLYLVVEKILTNGEYLPRTWPVHGTTGYEFAHVVNGLFVDSTTRKALDDIYAGFIGNRLDPRDVIYEAKKLIMATALSSEIGVLTHQLNRISEQDRRTRDFTRNSLSRAITEVIACFPVYRTYIRECAEPVERRDRSSIETAVAQAKQRNPATESSIFDFIRDVLLLRYPENSSQHRREQWCNFVKKFQQTTSAVMAKGLEDTAFYRYNRLVSLNEVGGDLEQFGVSVATFHHHNVEYQRRWPYTLLATSTHDSKRSEDVRARINVLSELPREWRAALSRWSRLNRRKKVLLDGQPAPDRNDEYLLYQTLLGTWPLTAMDAEAYEAFRERIAAYMLKAAREAKVHTSWLNPHAAYDEAVGHFVRAILDDAGDNPFLDDFRRFQGRVAHYGIFNSLAQTLLKIASPGVPDIYQGNELWEFNLVDPDNRRPVDFERRATLLKALQQRAKGDLVALARELAASKEDGRIKLYLTACALRYRRDHPDLFTLGEYVPLEGDGEKAQHLCAFLRRHGDDVAIAVVPRLIVGLTQGVPVAPLGPAIWQETVLLLPEVYAGCRFRNIFTGETVQAGGQDRRPGLPLAAVFATFPVALLERTPP